MKTQYQYIYFIKVDEKTKTSVWDCLSKKSTNLLGQVKWYCPWRQYCFYPEPDTVFNATCNEDINDFMSQL